MNIKSIIFKISYLVFIIFLFESCTTEDINPAIDSFSANQLNLFENGASVTINVKLNGIAQEQISIPLVFSGTATLGADYSLSSEIIIINKGSDSGSIVINSIDDSNTESIESIEVKIVNVNSLILLENYQVNIELLDNDTDTDGDGVPDSDDLCPTVFGDISNNGCPFLGFLINEVLYDPAAGLAGDANGDGIRDPNDDEFIEFYNSGPELDISGYRIFDTTALLNNTPRHIFPAGTIVPANGVIIVFGGGIPSGTFGGAIVQKASGGQLNISNAGDLITVQNSTGTLVINLDVEPFSDNPDESYTRNPDISGSFIQHSANTSANGALFSPGSRVNGTSF